MATKYKTIYSIYIDSTFTHINILIYRFIVKCGIAGGIVYQSVDQGLWGSSSRTIELYEDLSKLVEPVTKEVKQKIEVASSYCKIFSFR